MSDIRMQSIFLDEEFVFEDTKKDPSGVTITKNGNDTHTVGSKKATDRYIKRQLLKNRASNIVGNDREKNGENGKSTDKYASAHSYKHGGKTQRYSAHTTYTDSKGKSIC